MGFDALRMCSIISAYTFPSVRGSRAQSLPGWRACGRLSANSIAVVAVASDRVIRFDFRTKLCCYAKCNGKCVRASAGLGIAVRV